MSAGRLFHFFVRMKEVRQYFYSLRQCYRKLPEIVRFVLFLLGLSYVIAGANKIADTLIRLLSSLPWVKKVTDWRWPRPFETGHLVIMMLIGAAVVVWLALLDYKNRGHKSEN